MAEYQLAVIGESGGGKDEAGKHIAEHHDAAVHKFSSLISESLVDLGVPTSTPNMTLFSERTRLGRRDARGFFKIGEPPNHDAVTRCLERLGLAEGSRETFVELLMMCGGGHQGFGTDLYAKLVAEKCRVDPHKIAVANGIRFETDVKVLQKLPNCWFLYVTAPVEVLVEATRNRGEKDEERNMTGEQYRERLAMSTEADVPRLGRMYADFIYSNVGTKDAYHAFLDSVMATITGPQRPRIQPRTRP